jgi:outer membrane lipoprotein-sorting protein
MAELGRRACRLAAGLFISLCASLCATPAWAAFDLHALTALLAQRQSAQASFTEERFVSGIDGPLRASGRLAFRAPDHFERQTLQPLAESVSVDGPRITMQRGGRVRRMSLDAVPELSSLIDAIRSTLAGDEGGLRQQFKTRVEGGPALWTLTLTPRETHLGTQLRELKLAGQGSDLRSIELWLAGGDRSLTLLTPLPDPAPSGSSGPASAAR